MTSSYLNGMHDVISVNVFPRKLMKFPRKKTRVTGASPTTVRTVSCISLFFFNNITKKLQILLNFVFVPYEA